jgi:hypothetical protein
MSASRSAERMARRQRLLLAAAISTLSLALIPSSAAADADPASDFLLQARVFYPYQPATSPAIRRVLEATLAQLATKGLDLKVAILDSPTDMGGVSNLWNMPQRYSDFLASEISFNTRPPLLVVMPAGFGVTHAGAQGALNGVPVDSTHGSDGLARSAITAVVRLARVSGKHINTPAIPGVATVATRNSSGTSPLVFAAPVLLVTLAAGAVALLARRRRND